LQTPPQNRQNNQRQKLSTASRISYQRQDNMSTEKDQGNATRGSLRLAPSCAELEQAKSKLPRQFVNFTFYRARPEWRLLNDTDKQRCRAEFVATVDEFRAKLLIHTYSTVGLRTNVDFMIWRIGYELDPIQ